MTGEVTDAELVGAARRGDAGALGELVRRHQKQVFAVALSLLGDAAEAEDMAQETFIRASRNLDLLADPAKFAAWVRRIAFGVCVDWLRAFRPELYRSAQELEDHAASIPSGAPSPLERLENLELSRRVLGALEQLPVRYRAPLTMYHIEGLSHEKVAEALGVPVGTVRSLVSRARRRLAPLLAAYAKEVLPMKLAPRRTIPGTDAGSVAPAPCPQRRLRPRDAGAIERARDLERLGRRAPRGAGAGRAPAGKAPGGARALHRRGRLWCDLRDGRGAPPALGRGARLVRGIRRGGALVRALPLRPTPPDPPPGPLRRAGNGADPPEPDLHRRLPRRGAVQGPRRPQRRPTRLAARHAPAGDAATARPGPRRVARLHLSRPD